MSSGLNVATVVVSVLALAHGSLPSAAQGTNTALDPPPRNARVPVETCKLGGSLVHIPSKATGPQGLPVRISPPTKPRYPEGAPIAVQVSPVPALDEARVCLKESGFVDIGFQCPGGGARPVGGWGESGGRPGPEACMEALADVLTFADGPNYVAGEEIHRRVCGIYQGLDNQCWRNRLVGRWESRHAHDGTAR